MGIGPLDLDLNSGPHAKDVCPFPAEPSSGPVLDLFSVRVSLYSPGCPRTSYLNQRGLELIEMHLLLQCWD